MKNGFKTYLMLLTLLCGFSVAACSNDDAADSTFDLPANGVFTVPENIKENGLAFAKSGGTATLSVLTVTQLNVESDKDWCDVALANSTDNGIYKYEVTVQPNDETDSRSATIKIAGGNVVEEVKVLQAAADLLELADSSTRNIDADGGELVVSFSVTGEYDIEMSSWIRRKSMTRAVENKSETFLVAANNTGSPRDGSITFILKADDSVRRSIAIHQESNGAATEIPATELAAKIKIGWNLGNSLESCSDQGNADETLFENPKTTQATIDAVKAAGFNAVRIPCAWSGYIEDASTYKIKETWLARVKEVVDYCVNNEMYAIINIHWDGGWLENNPTYAKQDEVNRKQDALWTQIAGYFKDYGEHLLFAGTNEVHVDYSDPTAENHAVQQSFNQTFVDAVRATGGNNGTRNLIVQSYNTNMWYALDLQLPNDMVDKHLMVEVHCYDPWNYAGDASTQYWGYRPGYVTSNDMQEDYIDDLFGRLKTKFVDAGIPIIMGEYGTSCHSKTDERIMESEAYYAKYITSTAKKNGIVPFYWDNNGTGVGADNFGLFNRATMEIVNRNVLDAIMEGAETEYPF